MRERDSMATLSLATTAAFFIICFGSTAYGAIFMLLNKCPYTIWPGTLSGNGVAVLGGGGFPLASRHTIRLVAPAGWSGRIWARTGCNFDHFGNGNWTTGDCGSGLKCSYSGGTPPVTLAEFTIGGAKDFYDVSLVDGYNIGMGIRPFAGVGDCQYAGCIVDVHKSCPSQLQVKDKGNIVACRSACAAFDSPEYCCTGNYSSPATCPPTRYSTMFKTACPRAYSYAYDDASSTCTCTGARYVITFCP